MPADDGINPIPDCPVTWIFGLLETLEDRGGRDDGYKIARELQFKYDDLLKVMKAAEVLGFVSTPHGDVVLEPLGKKFLESDVNGRKAIMRERLEHHGLFSYLIRLLRGQEDASMTKEETEEHLAMLLPNEQPGKLFATIVNWGRFAELFGYNKDEDSFYLDQEE